MTKKVYEEANIAAIAQKIRVKAEIDTTYTTAEMPNGIDEVYEKGYTKGKSERSNKLAQIVDKTVTEITAEDLAGATSIGNYAFRACSGLTSVIIPDSVTSIGEYAFRGCTNLTNINIPNSITEIGVYSFDECSSIARVDINDLLAWLNIRFAQLNFSTDCSTANPLAHGNPQLYLNGELVEDLVLNEGYDMKNGGSFWGYKHIKTLVAKNVKLAHSVFHSSGLISADVGMAKEIGSYCFAQCENLKSVNLKGTVPEISSSAFASCTALESIVIPNQISRIRAGFSGCSSLKTIRIGNGITSISSATFEGCTSLTDIYIDKEEGSVTGAPWGAPNSPTIYWNTPLPATED